MTDSPDIPGSCPPPLQLGRAGWDILHSSAAVYPHQPTKVQQEAMANFIYSWSQLYACNWCAYHMRQYVQAHPPQVENKFAITRYVCELHNEVNQRLGKAQYDCDPMHVLKRWHPGFPDKMADQPSLEEKMAAEQKRIAAERKKKQEAQEAQEARLSVFGWQAGRGRKEPEDWRASPSSAAKGGDDSRGGEAGGEAGAAAATKPAVATSSRRWWFFGGSAYTGDNKGQAPTPSAASPTGPTGPSPSAPPPGSGGKPVKPKVADTETDVEAVLARLRACQVYCPEDEQILGNKTVSH